MSARWYDQLHDSLSTGLSTIARGGLKSLLASNSQPPGPDHNASAAPPDPVLPARSTRSNAFSKNLYRGQMSSTNQPSKYRTKNVSHLLDGLDRPEASVKDPVHIDLAGDDEDEAEEGDHKTTKFIAGGADPFHRTGTSVQPLQSERSGIRLQGGLSRRSPRITAPEDPVTMNQRKTPFKAPSSRYGPVNRLGGSNQTKSGYIQERTYDRRVTSHAPLKPPRKTEDNANDHVPPQKKRKTGDSREFGASEASAITLDDSQTTIAVNDSEDELALGSSKHANRSTANHVQNSGDANQLPQRSVSILRKRNGTPTTQMHRENSESSPTDEGDFTRDAARQRRAEKDGILQSSPEQPDQPRQAETSDKSPYFDSHPPSAKMDNPPRHKDPIPESPDALQGGVTHAGRERNGYGAMRSTHLGALIEGSDSSTAINKQARKGAKPKSETKTSFKLQDIVYPGLVATSTYTIEIDAASTEFSLHTDEAMLGDEPLMKPRSLRQLDKLVFAADTPSLVCLEFSRSGSGLNKIFLEFGSEKSATDFVTCIQHTVRSVKSVGREASWMHDARKKYRADCAIAHKRNQMKLPRITDPPKNIKPSASAQPNTAEKRIRLVDKLDKPSPITHNGTVISGADRSGPYENAELHRQSNIRPPSQRSISPKRATLPIALKRRSTRSREQDDTSHREQSPSEPRPKSKASEFLGPPWRTDLVYPHPGRRAAVVPFADLARLDDDEFLNDNLILFFMRYLETHMEKNNPELYKRTHFFNTYFYESLTKSSKGRKNINYDAVSRWTKNINLFSRDFVVVPVNENLHWYVAIICNLPYFLGEKGDSGWPETTVPVAQREESEDEADQPTCETQKSLADLSISDNEKEQQTPTKKKSQGRRKSVRRSLPKYEVNKPVIITLDSLGHGRSATCTHLKNYVALEAKDKRGLDIDVSDIRGMTAKEIPTQSNFSDCGLYVCVYLEQFVADPYSFIRRILQRDEGAQQWPRKIRSEDLRSKLRELIMEMHRRQEKESPRTDEPVIGKILIDKKEPSPTPEPEIKRRLEIKKIDEARKNFEELTSTRNEDDTDSSRSRRPERQNPLAVAHEQIGALEADPGPHRGHFDEEADDLIIDEEQSAAKAIRMPNAQRTRNHAPKQHRHTAPVMEVEVSPPPKPMHASQKGRAISHGPPSELAQHLRSGREGHDPNKKRRLTEKSRSSEKSRASRSPSRLTDELLSGEKAYLPLAGIQDFASRVSSPDRSSAGAKVARPLSRDSKLDVMVPESAHSSPEPKIVSERNTRLLNQTPPSKKRKRTSGIKSRAPETAEDLTREEFKGFDDSIEAEVLETQQTDVDQRSSEQRRRRKRGPRDDADDGEMLFTS
ncbi:hypothetical protein H2200_000697 [Cladophialophora chaetospira]|uniref:Ubiquitin-like protease family profile domain-containing protein n=1 Tax=Cladophialophora chaetospira TaxID=386627 RepID=A0AA39CR85_9EURO|nr:hypothetical protein H2200_000697 [Cladophialophora chaetospira]